MNDTVAGWDIVGRYGGTIDHNRISNSEREGVAVDGGRRQTVGYVRSRNFSLEDVVEEDVSQFCLTLWVVETCEIDVCIDERLIGWCKDREWAITLQCLEKFCLNHAGNQRIVLFCALCSPWNVVWRIRWRENLVDDVDNPIACGYIGHCYVRTVDHDASIDSERQRLFVDSICTHALGYSG